MNFKRMMNTGKDVFGEVYDLLQVCTLSITALDHERNSLLSGSEEANTYRMLPFNAKRINSEELEVFVFCNMCLR